MLRHRQPDELAHHVSGGAEENPQADQGPDAPALSRQRRAADLVEHRSPKLVSVMLVVEGSHVATSKWRCRTHSNLREP